MSASHSSPGCAVIVQALVLRPVTSEKCGVIANGRIGGQRLHGDQPATWTDGVNNATGQGKLLARAQFHFESQFQRLVFHRYAVILLVTGSSQYIGLRCWLRRPRHFSFPRSASHGVGGTRAGSAYTSFSTSAMS